MPADGGDLDRVTRVITRELQEGRWEGRGEEQRLSLIRGLGEDLPDVIDEADLEHLVCLVEDDDLRPREGEELLTIEVEDPAGCPDDDLRAILQSSDLGLGGLTADDQGDLEADLLADGLKHLRDLLGELAGGAEDEREHGGAARVKSREHRGSEGEGLTRAGLRAGDDVLTSEHVPDRDGLDGGGLDDVVFVERLDHLVTELPVAEALDVRDIFRGL